MQAASRCCAGVCRCVRWPAEEVETYNRSQKCLLVSNIVWMILSAIVLIACFLLQAGVSDVTNTIPMFVFRMVAYFALGVLYMALLGTVATCSYPERKRTLAVYCVLFTCFLGVSLFCLVYTFIYAAGLDTSSSLFYTWEFAIEMMQQAVVVFAGLEPFEWMKLQGMFDCCGVSMQKTYLYSAYGQSLNEFLDEQLSGELCSRGRIDIENLHQGFPLFEDSLDEQVANSLGEGFFCFQRMRVLFNFYSGSAGVVITMLFLFVGTICVLVVACILWCREPPTRPKRSRSLDFSEVSTQVDDASDGHSQATDDP